ncbi:MAG: helix-hairpin-helix domain-containing protein [Planctomycetota bacterium]|nr:helix-hairpin-helix domain-containing protein [Planctomycetota bacterium]
MTAEDTKNDQPPPKLPFLRRGEQALVAVLIAMGIGSIATYWTIRGIRSDDLIEIDHAEPLEFHFEVDLNNAPWPELVQLPNVGEATARGIVAERKANGPFESLEDLSHRVHGVGPKLVESIRKYVRPIGVAKKPESRRNLP